MVLRSTWANSSRDPVSKITRPKWVGSVAQEVEYLLCKLETRTKPWIQMPDPQKKKKKFEASWRYNLAVEHLPSMCEVPGFCPSTKRKKKKFEAKQKIFPISTETICC
jgi:hypothetical protein